MSHEFGAQDFEEALSIMAEWYGIDVSAFQPDDVCLGGLFSDLTLSDPNVSEEEKEQIRQGIAERTTNQRGFKFFWPKNNRDDNKLIIEKVGNSEFRAYGNAPGCALGDDLFIKLNV